MEAIDEEEKHSGKQSVITSKTVEAQEENYDYEALMEEFQRLAGEVMNKNANYYGPRITKIVETYFGKGKKIVDATIDQAELVAYVVKEMKEELLAE